jgi:hypothetical protein
MTLYSQGVLRISLVELAFRAFRTMRKKPLWNILKLYLRPWYFLQD